MDRISPSIREQAESLMELIGQRFGNIRVTSVVGQGGMGDVYSGYDEKLERKVAVKVLNADQRLDAEARERLLREARALSKLDHPNICRIHDYIESGDVDLLVLEYIDGQTLGDLMMEPKTMPRGEKLRIAIAIANVLVAAHRAGIIHRDLKPDNVMLAKGGEVKVLDFGLARWLQRARTMAGSSGRRAAAWSRRALNPDATVTLPPPADSSATAAGVTVGTPLYMSPEQARGEGLTSASDMFSFGLLLQALFTGQDPHPIGLGAREVMMRVARGETNAVVGVPGDITALIHRLKQFAPADRPTAVEALERLQFLFAKPQRIARRAVAAAIVAILAIGAWRYTVDLQHARARAIASEAEAVRRRAQAEELINFMVGDLRTKLEPVGRLDILDDVARRALAYSASLHPDQLSPEEMVRNAKALHQLVQVRIAQGRLDEALDVAHRANTFTDAAAKRDAQSADVQLSVGMSHFWILNVHRLRGELPQALKHAEAYRNVTARLAAAHPENREYQSERHYGEEAVAAVLEAQGDLPRAAEVYASSIAERRARVASDPASVEHRSDLALYLNKLGFVRQRQGDLSGARRNFEEEYAIYQALSSADPAQKKWRERLINAHSYLGGVLEALGDDEAALVHRRAEIAIGGELHDYDPANADWHRNLAIGKMRLGDLLRRRGEIPVALQSIEEAEMLLGGLVARTDARKSWRKDLAIVGMKRARALLALNRNAQAVLAARRARDELASLGFADPLSLRHAAEASFTLGEALEATNDSAGARVQWEDASRILEPLSRSSKDPLVLDIWSRTLLRLGRRADAAPSLDQIDRSGYHNRDLDLLRARRTG